MIAPFAGAASINADPSNYQDKIATLSPGDTLRLAGGTYVRLSLNDLNGLPDAWITIIGPGDGSTALITGESCCNTVQIRRCSYLTVKNLVIDSLGLPGIDGINVKDGSSHHLLIENNVIQGVGASQQTVGINTKSTVWNMTVRANVISEPGTGMYFGNSDGNSPFVAGVIEGNLVMNSIGYGMQIKHQNPYMINELPDTRQTTLIRHNTFTKDDRVSPDGNRPNLLVGTFPSSGQGSADRYEIYGNFLFHNPRESLIQATGQVAIHDNILVAAGDSETAIYLTDHNGVLSEAHIYNNTIYGGFRGIHFSDSARVDHSVIGNAVFADVPISGSLSNQRDNVTGGISDAGLYFDNPSFLPGQMSFYPLSGAMRGSSMGLPSAYLTHTDYSADFNGDPKGDFVFRGAYAGEGTNPGWQLDLNRKPLQSASIGSGVPKPPVLSDP